MLDTDEIARATCSSLCLYTISRWNVPASGSLWSQEGPSRPRPLWPCDSAPCRLGHYVNFHRLAEGDGALDAGFHLGWHLTTFNPGGFWNAWTGVVGQQQPHFHLAGFCPGSVGEEHLSDEPVPPWARIPKVCWLRVDHLSLAIWI